MPTPMLPASTLSAAKWKAVAKDQDKSLGIGDALSELEAAYRDLAAEAVLDMVKPETAANTQRALDELAAAEKKVIPGVCAKARAVSSLAKAKDAELSKKNPAAYKLLAPSLGKIVSDGVAYAKDVEKAAATLRADLEKHLARLRAEEKKKADDGADKEGEDEDGGDVAKLIEKSREALRKLPSADPVALKKRPYKFLVGVGGGKGALFIRLGTAFGEAQKKAQAAMLGLPKLQGAAVGDVSYEPERKLYVFACKGGVPGGAVKFAKLFIKNELGRSSINLVFRKLVVNKDGKEVAEDLPDEPIGDETVDAPAAGAGGVARPEARPATAPVAVAPIVRAAAREFTTARETYVAEVSRLARDLPKFYDEELRSGDKAVAKAVLEARKKLEAAATRIPGDLEDTLAKMFSATEKRQLDQLLAAARQQIQKLQALIDSDELIRSLDGNEFDENLSIVKPLQLRLKAIEKLLPA